MESSVKALAKLPKLVSSEFQGKDSPDDIAKVDTEPMKKALAGGDVAGPLNAIKAAKDALGGAVAVIEKGVTTLQEFIDRAPGAVKDAFSPPFPLCVCGD